MYHYLNHRVSTPAATAAAAAATAASSMYSPYNSPGAFVPHSAINLSVKSGETSNPHTSLDLTLTDASATVSNSSSYLGKAL